MKKPFSGGERTGQTTTAVGRIENERVEELYDYIVFERARIQTYL